MDVGPIIFPPLSCMYFIHAFNPNNECYGTMISPLTPSMLGWLSRLDLPWNNMLHIRIAYQMVISHGITNIPGTIAFSILCWDSVCDMCFACFSVLPRTIVVGASVVFPLFQTLPPYPKCQVPSHNAYGIRDYLGIRP